MPDQANTDEGADPSADLSQQNPGATTGDIAKGTGQSRAGAGEGPDADPAADDATKTQDLARAGRDDMDPNAGQE